MKMSSCCWGSEGVWGGYPPQQLLAEPAAGDPGGEPPPTNCWQMLLWGSGGGVPPLNQELPGAYKNSKCLKHGKKICEEKAPLLVRKTNLGKRKAKVESSRIHRTPI